MPKPSSFSSLIKLVLTTLAAAIGVQKKQNLEYDFKQPSFLPYIVAGLIFTALFVLALITVASLVTL